MGSGGARRGALAGAGAVTVDGRRHGARRVVIATGSAATWPPVEGIRDVGAWTNREAMEMRAVPVSAMVLGAGPVAADVLVSTIPAAAQTDAVVALIDDVQVVFEVVYDPWPTPLAAAAEAAGRTVVVSSHLLAEVEQTCDHVVVMARGRVLLSEATATLTGDGGRRLEEAFLDLVGQPEGASS